MVRVYLSAQFTAVNTNPHKKASLFPQNITNRRQFASKLFKKSTNQFTNPGFFDTTTRTKMKQSIMVVYRITPWLERIHKSHFKKTTTIAIQRFCCESTTVIQYLSPSFHLLWERSQTQSEGNNNKRKDKRANMERTV